METQEALSRAIRETQSFQSVNTQLQAAGLNADLVIGWVHREAASHGLDGSVMLTGLLIGLELGRVISDPAFGLTEVSPDQMRISAQDDPRGERDR